MDNQHRQIKGYRELTQAEIDLMNAIKSKGVELGVLVDSLRAAQDIDQRWVSIGATDLQTGLMALTRAPDLKAASWPAIYCSLCWARCGLTAIMLLPSAP